MKNKSILIASIMILCCVGLTFAQKGYLKIDGIDGESTERTHKDWITIESFDIGIKTPKAGVALGRGRSQARPVFRDLTIIKKLDRSTPTLMKGSAQGKAFPKLELEMLSNNGKLYYKVTLSKVKITSINTSTICDPDCELFDTATFSYSKITWEYWDSNGTKTEGTYDLARGI